jgi:hypothetical protein
MPDQRQSHEAQEGIEGDTTRDIALQILADRAMDDVKLMRLNLT